MIGLQVLEQAQFWYQHQLDQVSERHARIGTRKPDEEEVSKSLLFYVCNNET